MARFWTGWTEALLARFDRLAESEKKIVLAVCGALLVLVVGGSIVSNAFSVSAKRREIEQVNEQLSEIQSLQSAYQAAKQRQQNEERKFKYNTLSLFSHIQSAATRYGLTLYDLNERKEPVEGSSLVETAVVVNLRDLSIDRLTAFLQALEESAENAVVKVTRLKIRARQDASQLLDVQMTVSTWKSS